VIFGRRVRFALVVIGSHILLIALAIGWLIQMLAIARNGSVKFVEYNQTVLIVEIALISLISLFGIFVLYMQIKRLGEKRSVDRKESSFNRK
jgi:hypothetical protein